MPSAILMVAEFPFTSVATFDQFTGWSVVVTGIPQDRPSAPLAEPILASAVPRWAPWGDSRILYLATDIVSGRRLVHRPPADRPVGTFGPAPRAGVL